MPEAPRLPELARSLRSLGSTGSPCMQEAHEAIFIPLLDARSAAARGSTDDAMDALNGHAILTRIEAAVSSAASRGIADASRARALSAHGQEAIEPLRRALLALDEVATLAATDEGWMHWVDQLRRVFNAADDACRAIVLVLGERDAHDTPPRWFARPTR